MFIRHTFISTLLAVALLSTLGCGGSSDSSVPSTSVAGETTAEGQLFSVMDFSVTLPDELFAIDFATISLEEMPDVLERKLGPEAGRALNDRLQQTQYQQFVRTGGLKLFVIDTSIADPQVTDNVNFLVIPAPASLTQAAMLSANLSELQRLNVAVVKQDVFEANGITFDVLRCRFRETELDFLQYVTLTGGKSHTITFTARRDRADSLFTRAKEIMASYIPK